MKYTELVERAAIGIGIGLVLAIPIAAWVGMYLRGKNFALRDRLRKADAIVATAGTRGNLEFLNGKVRTAVDLYRQGWAPRIIFTGRFSEAVNGGEPEQHIPLEELEAAVAAGRLEAKDIPNAAKKWDTSLGAQYMRELAIKLGVPAEVIMTEDESLHTGENASYTASIIKQLGAKRIILVTSPFHQLRTALTFGKALQAQGVEIINHYADTEVWNPVSWFFSAENRRLVESELARIKRYRAKGDIL